MVMVMMMFSHSKRFRLKLSQYDIQCICIYLRLSRENNDDICQTNNTHIIYRKLSYVAIIWPIVNI